MVEQSNPSELRALHAQIEMLCQRFKRIRSEAAGIMQNNQMPDATLHLNDVLKSTEDATMTILDATNAISTIAETSDIPSESKSQIAHHIGNIYEACSFQDISGQRIRKVLEHLNELEVQLLNLSETVHGQKQQFVIQNKAKDSLLNGPQLSALAPSQSDVDAMFGQAE